MTSVLTRNVVRMKRDSRPLVDAVKFAAEKKFHDPI